MRKLLIAAFFLAASALGFAQGAAYSNNAYTPTGAVANSPIRVVSYATIRVCTEPATGTMCSPLALIYSDVGLTQALANPFKSDIFGNYTFFVAAGSAVHIQVSGPSASQYDIPWQYVGGGASANLSSPPPIGNVTPNLADFNSLTVSPSGSGNGIASLYQITGQTGIQATSGFINCDRGCVIAMRNFGNTGDNQLAMDSSNRATWNGNELAYVSEVANFSSPPPIGNVAPNTGQFTTLTITGEAIVPAPINPSDAATMAYVLAQVGSSGSVSPGIAGQFYENVFGGTVATPSSTLSESPVNGTGQLIYAGTGGASIAGPVQGTLFSTTAYTVFQLPNSPAISSQAWTIDGVSLADCTVGGSSGHAHYCYFTGSTWISGGGGAGTVNTGVTGAYGEYLSNTATISSSPSLSEASNILTYNGSGGIQAPGGFLSTSLTAGQLTLTRPSVANFLLSSATLASSYGWSLPTADALGVLRSPGGGTTSAPSQMTISPIATGDMVSSVRSVSGTTDTVLITDKAKFVYYTSGSSTGVTLPQATTTGFGAGFYYATKATGAGTVTITPTTSTIDGNMTLALTTGQECSIWSDGTNYFSGCGAGATGSVGAVQANGTPLSSISTVNFQNSSSLAGGIVLGFTNPSGGNVKFGVISGGFQGSGTLFQTGCGSTTTNDLISYDATGCAVDSGILKTALSSLSSLTAAGSSHTLANGNNPQTWGWAQTTNSQSAFTINETTAATGTSDILLNINTAAGSTAFPIQITAAGTTNGVRMSLTGGLSAIGTGAINANTCVSNLCLNGTGLTISSILRVSSSSTGLMAASSITDNLTIAGTTENWFTTNIADSTFKLPVIQPIGVASAVDSLGVTNSATANPATITLAAQGSDTNIGLNLTTKGAGQVLCNGGDCGLASTAFATVNHAASDFICNFTGLSPWTGCTQVGITKTYFATVGTIPTASTAGKIDGIHRGLTIATQFDALWPSMSNGITLALNACSSSACASPTVLWSSTGNTAAASSVLIGIPVNCTITVDTTTATQFITTCASGNPLRFLPTTGSPVVTGVPNTGANWVLVWSITYTSAAPVSEGVNLDSMIGTFIP